MTGRCVKCPKVGAERTCCPDVGILCREHYDEHCRAAHGHHPGCPRCGGKAHKGDCVAKP